VIGHDPTYQVADEVPEVKGVWSFPRVELLANKLLGGCGMKRAKILLSMVLVGIFSIICLSLAAEYKYVGSAKSNKYHYPSCQWALKIKPENLVTFESAKAALEAGYIPCKVCRPPTKD
jgi:hypothetical protein